MNYFTESKFIRVSDQILEEFGIITRTHLGPSDAEPVDYSTIVNDNTPPITPPISNENHCDISYIDDQQQSARPAIESKQRQPKTTRQLETNRLPTNKHPPKSRLVEPKKPQKQQQSQTFNKIVTTQTSGTNQNPGVSHPLPLALSQLESNNNTDSLGEITRRVWSTEEVRKLLDGYKAHCREFKADNLKQDEIWEVLQTEIGINRTWLQCKHKFRNLKKVYNKVMDTNRNSGGKPIQFDYMDDFNEMFSIDHNVTPPVTTSSFAVTQITVSDNEGEEEESGERRGIKKKNKKTVQAKMLDVMYEMREERTVRHQENVEQRNKLLDLIKDGNDNHKSLMEKLIDKF